MDTNDLIAAYSRDPVGFVPMEDPTVTFRQENTVCGDFLVVYLKITSDQKIEAFSYQGDPAIHTIAAASLLAEYICGQPISSVLTRTYDQMKERWLVVSARRQRSAVTALLATRNALHSWLHDGRVDTYEELLP
jgi:NifU-like protein involved in Fe-S cluster formation